MASILSYDDGEYVEFEEVEDTDIELAEDGSGFWLLASDDEESEDFYAFEDVEFEDE